MRTQHTPNQPESATCVMQGCAVKFRMDTCSRADTTHPWGADSQWYMGWHPVGGPTAHPTRSPNPTRSPTRHDGPSSIKQGDRYTQILVLKSGPRPLELESNSNRRFFRPLELASNSNGRGPEFRPGFPWRLQLALPFKFQAAPVLMTRSFRVLIARYRRKFEKPKLYSPAVRINFKI